ncbi:AAA-domain-containing protein [Aureobasidium pullulans]|uniref:Peroxisomal ATPase PEX1 n=1 Tax=Aureobasidium pullulans TaxID=5580 RepID=A0A4S9XUQ1_AURPU|nr:AAA-domain-containing protein [Aureobasidium pullulans]
MSQLSAKGSKGATPAEVVLQPQLKSCLVNLPSSLVSVLVNANTVAQNVVVELSFRLPAPPADKTNGTSQIRSIYLGWTGMQSQTRLAPIVSRNGIQGTRGNAARQDQDIATVEVDSTLARVLGISDGMKVGVNLHIDPPQAHTVNIEPLTPTDWDIIELHARFLETNFLSQVRALPNPAFSASQSQRHPLTLHLTPTSSANILVTTLSPAPPSTQPFVKISPDAEVIVAPKTRQPRSSDRSTRSVASTSRKSVGGRSTASTVRHPATRDEAPARPPLFLRGVDRAMAAEYFDEEDANDNDKGLRIWIDSDHLLSKSLKGVTWVAVSIVRPASLEEPIDPQKQAMDAEKPASKIVARLCAWNDAPDSQHAALSSLLCAAMASSGLVGGIVRIEAAPTQLPRTTSALKKESKEKEVIVKNLRVFPFGTALSNGLKFGGESAAEKEAASRKLKSIFGDSQDGSGLLEGPLTDGMILPAEADKGKDHAWPGGILRFDPSPSSTEEHPLKKPADWLMGSERKLTIEVQPEIAKPSDLTRGTPGHEIPRSPTEMVGIETLTAELQSHLLHSSSILLTGGLGSGKTSLTHLLANRLRKEHLFNVTYFSCRTLVTDETRVSTIKERLQKIFGAGAWGARLGGRSLVVLDDIDKLCPVETELQVGNDNGRSRQVSELLCSIARQYCSRDTGVVLLATAQAKESVNNVVIGGHVVRDILTLKAPNKDGRRKVLELLVGPRDVQQQPKHPRSQSDGAAWMGGSESGDQTNGAQGFEIDPSIDFLDVAGQTDGYMPGDLTSLVSRAQNEALIRSVSEDAEDPRVSFTREDFTAALKGFTPASLRGVTLQTSTTTWSSIGGLQETRQILLETLQYPTTYAPIFAQCPLRLRSGLLLYGYPGCGKTLLASAVAGECGLNFISVKGPEILNKYIGASEKSVRDLFDRAEAARPCVLFFDEFDSIAPKRGHDSTGVTDRVVNQLLTQMDGAEGLSGVYVLAATSRPDLIDPALLRPGRLDKSLLCDMPNTEDRLDILRAVTGQLKIESSILDSSNESQSLHEIARQTQGYSGADLQAVMYNAHLEAIHDVLGPTEDLSNSNDKSSSSSRSKSKYRDFTYFRYGDETLGKSTTSKPTPASLAERASISAKLASMEQARKRSKAGSSATATNGVSEKEEAGSQEPVISWRHIVKSLEQTRPSISKADQRRLSGIYREFVVGRNGEMADGEAGTEIGGRSTLM